MVRRSSDASHFKIMRTFGISLCNEMPKCHREISPIPAFRLQETEVSELAKNKVICHLGKIYHSFVY